jgi:hypothetical protein
MAGVEEKKPVEQPSSQSYDEIEKIALADSNFLVKYTRIKNEPVDAVNYKELALVVSTFLQEKKDSLKLTSDRKAAARAAWEKELAAWPKRSRDALVQLVKSADELNAASDALKSDAIQTIAFQSAVNRNFSKALDKVYANPEFVNDQLKSTLLRIAGQLEAASASMAKIKEQFKLEKKER